MISDCMTQDENCNRKCFTLLSTAKCSLSMQVSTVANLLGTEGTGCVIACVVGPCITPPCGREPVGVPAIACREEGDIA